jgi:hypothetical protein
VQRKFQPQPTTDWGPVDAAAVLFADILGRAQIDRATGPTCFELPGINAERMPPVRVWIVPGPERIVMHVRVSPSPIARATVQSCGLPEVPMLETNDEHSVPLATERPCPHCGRPAREYKGLKSTASLICRSCGCSFPAATFTA